MELLFQQSLRTRHRGPNGLAFGGPSQERDAGNHEERQIRVLILFEQWVTVAASSGSSRTRFSRRRQAESTFLKLDAEREANWFKDRLLLHAPFRFRAPLSLKTPSCKTLSPNAYTSCRVQGMFFLGLPIFRSDRTTLRSLRLLLSVNNRNRVRAYAVPCSSCSCCWWLVSRVSPMCLIVLLSCWTDSKT